MRWSVAALLGVGVAAIALAVALGGGAAVVIALVLVSAVGIWRFGPCRHPGPLGLLPPVTNTDGTRTSAQWFCDACGKSWAADFARDRRPIPRFAGHDESKAIMAARRAEDMDKRRRSLAVRRAGLDTPVSRPRLHVSADATHVVAMSRVRRFGTK